MRTAYRPGSVVGTTWVADAARTRLLAGPIGRFPSATRRRRSFGAQVTVTAAALAACLTSKARAQTGHFLTEPFLQNVKTDGITVMWEAAVTENACVEYGLAASYGETQSATREDSGASTQVYKAVLTGLLAGTTYHYRVVADGGITEDDVFVTAPDGAPGFSFGVWGDSQETNRGAYEADPFEPTKSMMIHMADVERVDFAVSCGDLAQDGESYADTRAYYLDRVVSAIGRRAPIFHAWGNHDGDSGSAVIRKFADMPSKDRGSPMAAAYGSFSFDYAGCHFVCIDYLREAEDILGWLESDLRSPAARNARFIFLFVHRAPYYERWYSGEEALRRDLVPLMEQYGVDVCFSGHMHGYERGRLNGVYYCVTGGGSWLDSSKPLVHDWPHMTVGGYDDLASDIDGGLVNEYVKVEVGGDTFTAEMMAFYADGTFRGVLDTFVGSTAADQVARPVIDPKGGVFAAPVRVSVSCITDAAEVRYTTDGSQPAETSPLYQGPFDIYETTTVTARAFGAGMTPSPVESATFTKGIVRTPALDPDGGAFADRVEVTIHCGTDGAKIRYTTDGTAPTGASTLYAEAITLTSSTVLSAKAFKDGMDPSGTTSATFLVGPDSDGDGLIDEEENRHGSNPYDPDSDADGLEDGAEVYQHETDPTKSDSDGDHMPDKWEVDNGLDPGADDASVDTDHDGYANIAEYRGGSHPKNSSSVPVADTATPGCLPAHPCSAQAGTPNRAGGAIPSLPLLWLFAALPARALRRPKRATCRCSGVRSSEPSRLTCGGV